MKISKTISILSVSALASLALCTSAFAETITMADAGYGVNGGKSFTADGITAYSSTLGDLADNYDSIDFTISVADLGGREDLSYQVYVAAGDWSVWANGLDGDTPPISEAGTEYSFSLNVDDIADTYGRDLVICDMGFQILSAAPGDIDVTYTVSFSENGSAANKPENDGETSENGGETSDEAAANGEAENDSSNDKDMPNTGVEGVAVCMAASVLAVSAIVISKKRK